MPQPDAPLLPEIMDLELPTAPFTAPAAAAPLVTRPKAAVIRTPADSSPMGLLALALKQGAPLETLEKFMDLSDRFEKAEARKAFVSAMAGFKSENVVISKDKANLQYASKYVSLGHLVSTVTPFLSKWGLSVRWEIEQAAQIRVSCVVTHEMGHSETVSFSAPPDKSGAKNGIQEIKSSITYGKAVTFESICGLASTDANLDDDGNGAGPKKGNARDRDEKVLTESELEEHLKAIRAAGTLEGLRKVYGEAYKATTVTATREVIVEAYEAAKKSLAKGGAR